MLPESLRQRTVRPPARRQSAARHQKCHRHERHRNRVAARPAHRPAHRHERRGQSGQRRERPGRAKPEHSLRFPGNGGVGLNGQDVQAGLRQLPDGMPLITPRIPPCNKPGRANSSPDSSLRGDEHILDVGCGDGKVTAEIARAVPRGSVVGIDASPEMIAVRAQSFSAGQISNLEFQVMDARKSSGNALVSPSPPQRRRGRGERRLKTPHSALPAWAGRGVDCAVRPGFFQRGLALGGRSPGDFARRGGVSAVPADGWWFRAAARATRRTFLSRCGRKCG